MKPTTRLTLIAFLLFMARGMSGPISSVTWRSLGASYLLIGLLGTMTSLTAIVASPIWGRASDRLGQRRAFLIGGLAALTLGMGLVAVAPGYLWLFPIYAVTAVAQAAYDTGSLALMGDWLEHRGMAASDARGRSSGRRMGTYRGLASLGFGLMAFVSGTVADRLSLRAPFILAAAFMGVGLLLALGAREAPSTPSSEARGGATSPPDEPATAEPAAPESTSPAGRLPLAPLLVAALLWSLVTGAVYAVWANYMVEDIGYSSSQMTRLWALASLTEFPLMIVAGWLSDRVGRLPMLVVGFLAWTVVFAGYVAVPVMPWIVLVQLTRGFAYSAHTATALTYAAEVRGRSERGRMSGLYGTAGALGSILGSSLGGAATQFLGFRAMIGAGAAVTFVGALYLAGVALRYRRSLLGT